MTGSIMTFTNDFFQLFIKGATRENQQAPFCDSNRTQVFATNGAIAVAVPYERAALNSAPAVQENMGKTLMGHQQREYDGRWKIGVGDLRKVLKEMPEKEYYPDVLCDDCEGDGEIACDCCGAWHECETCKGIGELPDQNAEPYVDYAPDHHIFMGNRWFRPHVVDPLVQAMQHMGAAYFDFYYQVLDSTRPGLAIYGEAAISMMPVAHHQEMAEHFITPMKVVT